MYEIIVDIFFVIFWVGVYLLSRIIHHPDKLLRKKSLKKNLPNLYCFAARNYWEVRELCYGCVILRKPADGVLLANRYREKYHEDLSFPFRSTLYQYIVIDIKDKEKDSFIYHHSFRYGIGSKYCQRSYEVRPHYYVLRHEFDGTGNVTWKWRDESVEWYETATQINDELLKDIHLYLHLYNRGDKYSWISQTVREEKRDIASWEGLLGWKKIKYRGKRLV